MAKIYAPNKNYSGSSAGISFANGMAETDDPYLVEWFGQHGYTVEGTSKEGASYEKDPEEKSVNRKLGRARKKQA